MNPNAAIYNLRLPHRSTVAGGRTPPGLPARRAPHIRPDTRAHDAG